MTCSCRFFKILKVLFPWIFPQNDASNTRTMMYVLHVNEVHEMWQDAARGNLRLIICLIIYLFVYLVHKKWYVRPERAAWFFQPF